MCPARRMVFRLIAAAAIGIAALAPHANGAELAPAPTVTSLRLYVFDCGTLVYNKPEDYNLKRDEVKDTNMGVTCYLVVHPKGMLIYGPPALSFPASTKGALPVAKGIQVAALPWIPFPHHDQASLIMARRG